MTTPKRGRQRTSGAHSQRPWNPWIVLPALIVASVAGLVLMSRSGAHSDAPPVEQPPSLVAAPAPSPDTDVELTGALDRLLVEVAPGAARFASLPLFARETLQWAFGELRSGRLRVVLLDDFANTNLNDIVLMASGLVEGLQSIVVVRPRFIELLAEGGGPRRPFTSEQVNDFALGLIHEAVHLRRRGTQSPDQVSRSEALDEEILTWREVNREVVRPLRAANQPVHAFFIQVDDAFRACGDHPTCRPAVLLAP